ncbi:MAG TPA: glycosyltransferase family 39 protein [Rhodospirillales bacterium]|jgi:hypothetical protein|nr:glycosyltransferase family 39 protein [Rhodospirillales bacterium]
MKRISGFLPPLLIFALGFLLNDHYAWDFGTFETIDGGLISDAAWRISQGQIPFEDFGTIQGLSAALLEALFITLFGANLTALVVHTSFVNGAAGVVVYLILRLAGAGRAAAFCFAALTTIIFYPPEGLAFAIQHGSFYVLLALLLALWVERAAPPNGVRFAAWTLAGACLGLGYLGKPTIAFYYPVLVLFLFIDARRTLAAKAAFASLGFFLPFLALAALADDPANSLSTMWQYLVQMPMEFGGGRLKGGLNDLLKIYALPATATLLCIFGGTIVGAGLWRRSRDEAPKGKGGIVFADLNFYFLIVVMGALLGLGNAFISGIHEWWARGNLLQMIFPALGLVAIGITGIVKRGTSSGEGGLAAALARGFLVLFLFISAFDAWWIQAFYVKHDGKMKNISQGLGKRLDVAPELVYPEIAGARFREPLQRKMPPREVLMGRLRAHLVWDRENIGFLKGLHVNILLLDLPKYYYLFSGKVSPLPVISVQPGASSPFRDSLYYPQMIARLEDNFEKFGVGALVLSKERFAELRDYVSERPGLFCGASPDSHAVLVILCAPEGRPQGWGRDIAHMAKLDGALY